ncbi:hypothetical protein U91I_03553 [alpha proteobacterium U9-1i]|nr:hypothetical protein U91I_03553 [alpha proteobacterium U9-1i]
MPTWILLAGLAAIALTAALTWVLWRINAPRGVAQGGDSGAPFVAADAGSRHETIDAADGGGDGGD